MRRIMPLSCCPGCFGDDARRGLQATWHDDVEVVVCGASLLEDLLPALRCARFLPLVGAGRLGTL